MEARQAALRAADPYAAGETILLRAYAHEHAELSAWVPGHAERCASGQEHMSRRQNGPAEADRRRRAWSHSRQLSTDTLRTLAGMHHEPWLARMLSGLVTRRTARIERYREAMTRGGYARRTR